LIPKFGQAYLAYRQLEWQARNLIDAYIEFMNRGRSVHKRGPKPKWTGLEGLALVLAVDHRLAGPARTIREAIKKLQKADPKRWRGDSEVLRVRYTEARWHVRPLMAGLPTDLARAVYRISANKGHDDAE